MTTGVWDRELGVLELLDDVPVYRFCDPEFASDIRSLSLVLLLIDAWWE